MSATLLIGGIRSGKSATAERLIGDGPATYLATGPRVDDADWSARIEAHRRRRPATWRTIESSDLVATLARSTGPVLIDALPTWLSAQLDALNAWDDPQTDWETTLVAQICAVQAAIVDYPDVLVIVSQEVGLSLIPDTRAGRIFADWLGTTNQAIARACDEVLLVVAGRTLSFGR